MILLNDIREFLVTLGIVDNEHCYCGKMDDKKDCSVGVYNLKSTRQRREVVGGEENASYYTKALSILVHGNRSPTQTESMAIALQEKLKDSKNILINGHKIMFINIPNEEPIPVDTDESGIFEYVIECLFYVERNEENVNSN